MYKKYPMTRQRFSIIHLFIFLTIWFSCAGKAWTQMAPAANPGGTAGKSVTPRGNISSEALKPKSFEAYDAPSLAGSDLEPLPALTMSASTIDGVYTHEVTRVQWRPADSIDLYIVKPVGVRNPPVVLYLYSYPFEMDRFLNHDFCKFLVKDGYAAVGFPSFLTAARYHDVPMKDWFVSELRQSLAATAHDVQMILNYLSSRGDLDMNRVGMFGDGSGASIAILAAAVDRRIKTLDLLDPWGDWPDWIAKSTRIPEKERPDYMKPEWLAQVAPLDPVKWLPQLKTQKIRIQFIKTVDVTPLAAQQKIEAAAPPNAQIVHYDDATAFKKAIAGGTGFDWIKQEMRGGKAEEFRTAETHAAAPARNADSSRQ
jgi:hypothetical protein